MDIGGGEYSRVCDAPAPRADSPGSAGVHLYRVGRGQRFQRLHDAINAWRHDKPTEAIIEITDSAVFVEPVVLKLEPQATLVLRAASGVRPVIRLLDWQTDLPDALAITMGPGSQITLDGLLITGRGVVVSGPEREPVSRQNVPACASQLRIRHCTLVPGWGLGGDCAPERPLEPSLDLNGVNATVTIEHSIIGSVLVREDAVASDPIDLHITDSILDATEGDAQAVGGLDGRTAHVAMTINRSTIFGVIQAHAVLLAENTIFNDCVHVARRQIGCIRYCYVPSGCRTPRRHACQPDLAIQAVTGKDPVARAALVAAERIRLRPAFTQRLYRTARLRPAVE